MKIYPATLATALVLTLAIPATFADDQKLDTTQHSAQSKDTSDFHIASVQENVSGRWLMVSPGFTEQPVMLLAEDDRKILMIQRFFHKGHEYVEYGTGERTAESVVLNVTASRPFPGWTPTGIHTLVLSEDGMTLEGSFESGGETGVLKFKRLGKENLLSQK